MRISIFDNQHKAIKELPQDRQGAFWCAFFGYVFDGVEPEFSEPMERMAWNLVLPHIEKSLTASENGSGGKSKAKSKPKSKLESKPESKLESKDAKQAEKQTPLEGNRREGLGESLKDSLTPSTRGACAGGEDPAPPRADKAERDMAEQRAIVAEMEANASPCPPDVMRAAMDALAGGRR